MNPHLNPQTDHNEPHNKLINYQQTPKGQQPPKVPTKNIQQSPNKPLMSPPPKKTPQEPQMIKKVRFFFGKKDTITNKQKKIVQWTKQIPW